MFKRAVKEELIVANPVQMERGTLPKKVDKDPTWRSEAIFTREEAERTLPLVRRVVADLTVEYPAWRAAVARFELLTGGARADWGETQELVASREEVTRHANRINQYLQELEAIGCVFKGFEAGLVDFYSLREDRPIFLCWRLGEERIEHWHEIDTGFSSRQPIDGSILSAISS